MEGSSGISPFERFGHCTVEVVDELSEPLFEFLKRGKTRPFEEAAGENTEPDFDLI